MKILLAAFVTTAFAAGAMADDIYYGFAKGNPDLNKGRLANNPVVAVQPGVGDSLDPYHGLDDGNADLFRTPKDEGARSISENPAIFSGFRDPGLYH